MIEIAIVALLAAVAAATIYAVLATIRRPERQRRGAPAPSWLDDALRTRLRVHTVKGPTFEGVVDHVDGEGLVLLYAKFMHETAEYDLDGGTWIPRTQVLFVQTVGAPAEV